MSYADCQKVAIMSRGQAAIGPCKVCDQGPCKYINSNVMNQCDGCRAGWAISKTGVHLDPARSNHMRCTKNLYVPEA